MNLKAKLTMRKAFGFKTGKCLEIALYHTLGALPELNTTTDSADDFYFA